MGAIEVPAGADSGDSARLENATHTSLETIALSRVMLVFFGLTVLAFILLELPWTAFRLRHRGLTGWALSSKQRSLSPTTALAAKKSDDPALVTTSLPMSLPRRIGRLPLALPTYTVPRVNLSIPQAALLVVAFVLVTIASFAGSNWLNDSTRTGYVAITLVPCVIALGNKVFGVGTFLSVGYAAVNWAHRWLGRLLWLVTTIHVIAYFIVFAQTHAFKAEMSKPANAMATVGYFGFCLIFFASIGYVRRNWWHIFKICHHFGIFLFVIGLNYHSKILRPWVVFCVMFVGINALARAFTSRLHIAYLTALPSSKSTIVHLPSVRSGWIPGQSVRIRVLTGGMGLDKVWEGHPFTLATAPSPAGDAQGEAGAKLVVKAAGDWTNKLFQVAKKGLPGPGEAETAGKPGRGYPVAVLIEGPYGGCNLVYSAFGSVLLGAGGSGVSYILGVANGIISDCRAGKAVTRNLDIVWTVRDRAAINDLLPNFEEVLDAAKKIPYLKVTITLYYTSVSRGLVIRPFSIMPTAALFNHQPPSALPPSGLRNAYTPNTSTAALLGPGNSSAVDVSSSSPADPRTGLAAPPQFILGREEDAEEDADPNDAYAGEEELDPEEEKAKINPFSDLHAPVPPSPTTKPRFNTPKLSNSPPIELKPGRPEYNHIVQAIIEREQAHARSFKEHFRIMNTGAVGAGRIAVGACGPSGMVASLRDLCWGADGVEFHAEEFSL